MRARAAWPAIAPLLALAWAGCSEAPSSACRQDGDCEAGAVCVAGRCAPLVGSGGDDAGAADDLAGSAAGADLASAPPPDGFRSDALAPACNFNGDGVITRDELPVIVGLGGLFAVNGGGQPVTVDVQPHNGAWDYAAPSPGDQKIFDELLSPAGAWWAADFPDATYAERLDATQPILGVFKSTKTALQMIGVVSEQGGLAQTELKYATPIDVVRFPLQIGAHWSASSTVSGLAQGVFFTGVEQYDFSVDLRGRTQVPAGGFDTLRLHVKYTQTVGLLVTTRITYVHMAECYGAVARIRSRDDEPSDSFTQAAEYRRLAAP